MLQTFYNNFGFLGSLAIAFGGFMFTIFWISGIAGICNMEESRFKNLKMVLSVLFPPYPFFWILFDMYHQSQQMKEK
ncbi:hypothetical protein NC796_24170 [Aliifodinibius sp. S!AR15-10]|uniref:hypothetical protein n=1 Tax=Aliifodinibius sp. S!AR15-10 TaxID=2950437 RepID=UPI00285DC93C|nr:hypothetical protein [Aliifodinibius sp. S!AR15-10]MDR8394266.1 hypothetical protein [Aliifodinibius sp. S!AR15-10]